MKPGLPWATPRRWLDVAGGSLPPPRAVRRAAWPLLLAAWWLLLFLTALAFIGRATRFIYVDF